MTKKILIVDDQPEIAQAIAELLSDYDFECSVVFSGQEAIDSAILTLPDLILLDVVMPEIGGPDVAKMLMADDFTKQIPVVFLSGLLSSNDNLTMNVEDKLFPVLAKPSPPEKIVELINITLFT